MISISSCNKEIRKEVDSYKISGVPHASKFIDETGKIKEFFLRRNPWKVESEEKPYKIYRFCIVCGKEKFTHLEWIGLTFGQVTTLSQKRKLLHPKPTDYTPLVCKQNECATALDDVTHFLPSYYYSIKQSQYKNYSSTNPAIIDPYVRSINTVIHLNSSLLEELDLYKTDKRIILKIEKIRLKAVFELDRIFFGYIIKKQILIKNSMEEASDPYLQNLFLYRQKLLQTSIPLKSKL